MRSLRSPCTSLRFSFAWFGSWLSCFKRFSTVQFGLGIQSDAQLMAIYGNANANLINVALPIFTVCSAKWAHAQSATHERNAQLPAFDFFSSYFLVWLQFTQIKTGRTVIRVQIGIWNRTQTIQDDFVWSKNLELTFFPHQLNHLGWFVRSIERNFPPLTIGWSARQINVWRKAFLVGMKHEVILLPLLATKCTIKTYQNERKHIDRMALNLNVCACVLVLVHTRAESSALHELGECNFGLRAKLTIFQMFEKLQLNPNNTLIQMLTQNEMKRYKFIISLLPFVFFSFPCVRYGLLTAFSFCLRLQHPQYINQKHTNPWSIDAFCTYFDFVFWRFIFLFHSPLAHPPAPFSSNAFIW